MKTRLVIYSIPPSLNQLERMHWAVKRRLRRRFANEIYHAWYENGTPILAKPCKQILGTTIYWKTRRLDEDNAVGSLKIIIDAMRDIKMIYRDSPKWLTVNKPIQRLDHINPRVEIELEETQ